MMLVHHGHTPPTDTLDFENNYKLLYPPEGMPGVTDITSPEDAPGECKRTHTCILSDSVSKLIIVGIIAGTILFVSFFTNMAYMDNVEYKEIKPPQTGIRDSRFDIDL